MKPRTKLILHQFCMTLLSESGESNKTNANKVSYEASYEAPLTRKTSLSEFALSKEPASVSFCVFTIDE